MDIQTLKALVTYCPDTGIFYRLIKASQRSPAGSIVGGKDAYGYICGRIDGKTHKLHRLAWFYMTGEWPPEQIDHINGDRADNRWCNLRLANHAQNARNAKRRNDNTSGYKGVTRAKGKWAAQIYRGPGKSQHIGYFNTPEEAHEAYCEAAKNHFGPFAAP